jgi:hypothetical protein
MNYVSSHWFHKGSIAGLTLLAGRYRRTQIAARRPPLSNFPAVPHLHLERTSSSRATTTPQSPSGPQWAPTLVRWLDA